MKRILFLGRFPPPVHGASKMNEVYFKSKTINKEFKLQKIKINYSDSLKELGKFNLNKFFGIFIVFFKLLVQLISFNPHLIYFEIPSKGLAFVRDSIYVFLCKIFNKKIIFVLHSREISRGKLKKIYYKLVFKNTKLILLSKLLYPYVKEFFKEKDVYYLGNGIKNEISDNEFKTIIKTKKQNKKPILLFLSNMIESKGALEVLRICNSLNEKGIDFECLFVGPWKNKEFKVKWENFLQEKGLKDKCSYLGAKYGNEKEEIMKKANFMIFPTKYELECFPLVILEAFMYGIPVLSYDTGAIKEIISKEYLGYVSKKNSWKELETKLKKIIKEKVRYKRIREYFKDNFTIEIAEKRLNKILLKNTK